MRIAICTDQYLPMISGLVDSVQTLAEGLRTKGHAVRIYAPSLPGEQVDKDVYRFPSYAIPGSGGTILLNLPLGALRDMRRFKPDVIHTELFGMAGFLAWYAARRLNVPLVGTDHTFPADYLHYLKLNFVPFPYLVRKFAAWYYNRCDIVTTPSQKMMDELVAYGMYKHSRIISNPVPSIFRPLPQRHALKERYRIGARAIVIFGRIAVEKNLEQALAVYADVADRSSAELVLIGDGPYRVEMEKRVVQKGLRARTRFLGILRGEVLVEAINACDVLLITSTSENQPMTLLQAMACGLPTVTADAGGLPEYVQDGVTGYIVPTMDTRLFADRIIKLLEDPTLANQFGEAARKSAERFSPEHIAKEFEGVYNSLTFHKKVV
ncbi:MAG: glycosyltransferase [bacterium]|nr:glycosyltransferase [bacterium]